LQRGKMTSPRPPSPRNNKRGASAPTHIGMLNNNAIRIINNLVGSKKLSRAVSEARVQRSLKGLMLLPKSNRPRVVYDPKYQTLVTNHDTRRNSTWRKTMHNLTYNPSVENMKMAAWIKYVFEKRPK
jgi:hypothetical protein